MQQQNIQCIRESVSSNNLPANIQGWATPALVAFGQTMEKRLGTTPNTDILEAIVKISVSGTTYQRLTLGEILTYEVCFAFPVIKCEDHTFINVVEVVKLGIQDLAITFGVKVAGDIDAISFLLASTGGLTLPNVLHFFHLVKKGRFREKTEHTQTQGINQSFVSSWLNCYLEEKDEQFISIWDGKKSQERKIDNTVLPLFAVAFSPKNEEIHRKNMEKANNRREDFALRHRCTDSEKMRTIKKESLLTYLFALYLRPCCVNSLEEDKLLQERLQSATKDFTDEIKEYFFRSAIANAERLMSKVAASPHDIFRKAIKERTKNTVVLDKIGQEHQIAKIAAARISQCSQYYKNTYLPEQLQTERYPLELPRFIAADALREFSAASGNDLMLHEVLSTLKKTPNDDYRLPYADS